VPPAVVFPALAVIALGGFAVGVVADRWYLGTAVAVVGWALFVLIYRQVQLRRRRR
jgi:hypothetical protein